MKRQKTRKLLLLISFMLFPITLFYFSPVLIIQGSFLGIATGSFLIFAALFFFSLVFGRAFCGWICPAGGLQECCSLVVDKKITGKNTNRIKYIIWVPWLFTIILGFITAGGIKSVNFFYMTDHGISASGVTGYIVYLFIIALITVLALTLGKRGMCHSICWMAPFMIIGTKIKDRLGYPSLHLETDSKKCVQCGLCSKACPMSIDVVNMVQTNNMRHNECILCGGCADCCNKKAIRLTFAGKKKTN
ncbi:4Fe-4S binding protein [Anaerocolumna xylanovorans]|uniref:4Fe-4S binding domain-containing protein n=1 Tax=Anaerocolumna xylanovorans DSM 12503 TaxID=1121345 RepID=A0A1M7YFM7_9FIRM|nr:4Fe-4S binding protein [Anaerocolumna xylanovorans]SHO51369.1 4Fe-4S binding domain-containing protein [Anaerocolumna xylanovorans DSM 12503]